MKIRLFMALFLTILFVNTYRTYAAGYHFLFTPSTEFSEVDYALPDSDLYVVSDGKNNNGICDSDGKLVLPLKYARIDVFSHDHIMLLGNDGDSYSAFDPSTRKILYTHPSAMTVYDNVNYYETRSDNGFGVANHAGEQIIPSKYSSVSYMGGDRFLIMRDGTWSVSDGKTISPLPAGISFSGVNQPPVGADYSSQNWLLTTSGGKWGVINKNFNIMIPFMYDDIQSSQNGPGYFIANKDKKTGLIDQNNTVCVPFLYDTVQSIYKGSYLVAQNSDNNWEYGVVDIKGNFTVPLTNDRLEPVYLSDDYPAFIRKTYMGYGVADLSTPGLRPCLKFFQGEKVGIMDLNGQILLPALYNYLYSVSSIGGNPPYIDSDAIIAVKDSKTGVITINGETVIPFQYDGIYTGYGFPNNYYRAEYFVTQIIDGSRWIIGAVNRQNERVAENYYLNLAGGTPDGVSLIEFSPDPGNGHQGLGLSFSFSPINGLTNGVSGVPIPTDPQPFRTTPESPVLSYGGYQVVGNRLMYGASYKGRGTVVVFDDFKNAAAPVLSSWERDIRFTVGDNNWIFNGATLENDVAPFLSSDNRAMVPIRVIAHALGAAVFWDDVNKADIIKKGDKLVTLTVGEALPDNMGTPILKNDRLFVPARYVAEAFGGEVSWDQTARTAAILFKPAQAY